MFLLRCWLASKSCTAVVSMALQRGLWLRGRVSGTVQLLEQGRHVAACCPPRLTPASWRPCRGRREHAKGRSLHRAAAPGEQGLGRALCASQLEFVFRVGTVVTDFLGAQHHKRTDPAPLAPATHPHRATM